MPAETLTRAGMAERVRARTGLSRRACEALVEAVFDLLRLALEEEGQVRIAGFGSFTVRPKAARVGRNPQTGERIVLARRQVLVFRASPALRQALARPVRR